MVFNGAKLVHFVNFHLNYVNNYQDLLHGSMSIIITCSMVQGQLSWLAPWFKVNYHDLLQGWRSIIMTCTMVQCHNYHDLLHVSRSIIMTCSMLQGQLSWLAPWFKDTSIMTCSIGQNQLSWLALWLYVNYNKAMWASGPHGPIFLSLSYSLTLKTWI